MSEPLDPDRLLIPELEPGFGLAPLKEEGGQIPGLGPRRPPPTLWQRISRRLRALPSRLYWALFGEVY